MERYFFDVEEHGRVEEDTEGQEHADLSAVRRTAIEGARELMAIDLRKGVEPDGRTFKVRDVHGKVVLSMLFKDAIGGANI